MKIEFFGLEFEIRDAVILLTRLGNLYNPEGSGFCEVQISGENKDTHMGAKMARSSEGGRLKYVSHSLCGDTLSVIQRSPFVEIKTVFTAYPDAAAVRVHNEIKNISDEKIVLEEVSSFVFTGIGSKGIDSAQELFFTRFLQSHHAECQPRRRSFKDWGLFRGNVEGQKRLSAVNVGSWSTKEDLPQGIIEDSESCGFTMFEIESNASWYYEIADVGGKYYFYLGGANLPFGGWSKMLLPDESYRTVSSAVAFGNSLSSVIGEMTKYRRSISGRCVSDENLPTIFNEYMHLSWDSPTAENTKRIAPVAAKAGVEYYVIDCGWHNEEPGCEIYPYVGQWKESKARFPEGVRKTTDYIRSLGMKAGLWIEPEIIGTRCREMLDYYDDSCFLQRNGRKISVMNRYFLDYRNEKVRSYMSETIRRMVEDYGADYIKFDYNQDCGVGTDYLSLTMGEGLESAALAFFNWTKEMTEKYPEVIFEGCASGGMRMDYKSLSLFPIISTSDQTDYLKYPYIAGNILSAVTPEQAAVWSYPVGVGTVGLPLSHEYDEKWVRENISCERIAMNMINSFLGRMHLASHLELLSEEQSGLVREGVEYYNSLTEAKKRATPVFPLGLNHFGDEIVVGGFEDEKKIYLALWNLSEEGKEIVIPIDEGVISAEVAYPKFAKTDVGVCENELRVRFEKGKIARFVELIRK